MVLAQARVPAQLWAEALPWEPARERAPEPAQAQRREASSLAVQALQRVGEEVGPPERQLPKGSARPLRERPSKPPPGRDNPQASADPDKP